MTRRFYTNILSFGLVATALVTIALIASAQDEVDITAEGYGAIYNEDISAARDRAIEDAQRKAVEQAVGTLVSSETVTQNFQLVKDEILTQSKGFIKKWTKVSEERKGGELAVKIAAKVSMEKVMDSDGMANLIRRMGKPKLMVLLAEQNIGDAQPKVWWDKEKDKGDGKGAGAVITSTDLSITENTMIDSLKKFGFDFIDRQALANKISASSPMKLIEDDKAVKEIAHQTDAEVVIVGKAIATNAGQVPNTKFYSGQANISLRALKTDTGEIIATVTTNGGFPHIDANTAGSKALEKVADKAAKELVAKITQAWQKESSGTRYIHMTVQKIGGFSALKKFNSWASANLRGVKAINNVKVNAGNGEMDIDYSGGNAQALADEIVSKKYDGKELDVVELTPNKLIIVIK